MGGPMEDLAPWVSGRDVRSVALDFEATGQLSIIQRKVLDRLPTVCSPNISCIDSASLPSNRPRCISRWLSSEGFEGRASRIFALSWLTVVDAGRRGKVKGLATPEDGDTTARVNPSGSGCISALAGLPACSGAPAGRDIVVGAEARQLKVSSWRK